MIILTDVAAKLSEILNSVDCPVPFNFVVKSSGYHLDSIADHKTGENQIPVFLTIVGGEYNPVPNLHEVNFTYGVSIWFPVRFKEDFYALNEYLEETFVGKKIQIGDKVALCNISVAEYGEITGLHLDQFEEWLEDTYEGNVHIFKKEHDISEEYMSMEFRLFCTTLGTGFIFGNDVKYKLSMRFPEVLVTKFLVNYVSSLGSGELPCFRNAEDDKTIVGVKYYAWYVTFFSTITIYTTVNTLVNMNSSIKFYKFENNLMTEVNDFTYINYESVELDDENTQDLTEQLVWDQSGTGASISPVSEQLIGVDKFVRNTENITNFNKSITVYVRDNNFWGYFLTYYNEQKLDEIKYIALEKTYTFGTAERKYNYYQVVLSYNENVSLGNPLSFTLTFGD